MLARFLTIAGIGHVDGPYVQETATMDVHRWKGNTLVDIERLVATIWPWLGPVKREQARFVLDTVRAQPELPRGNPVWGNRKTHCIHGHEYATARLRPYVSRGASAFNPAAITSA